MYLSRMPVYILDSKKLNKELKQVLLSVPYINNILFYIILIHKSTKLFDDFMSNFMRKLLTRINLV